MNHKTNKLIEQINSCRLQEFLDSKYPIEDIDSRYAEYTFIEAFEEWLKKVGTNKIYIDQLKSTFSEYTINNRCKDRGIVYMWVYDNNIIYIGSTSSTFSERYNKYEKARLLTKFFNNHHTKKDISKWRIYILKTDDYRKLESKFINYFTRKGVITLNSKCENIKDLLR